MKLVVGLGNPGSKYTYTRHNVGFMVLDRLSENDFSKQAKFDGLTSEVSFGGEKYILLKPDTFMNLSGQSVQKAKKFYNLENNDIWVVSDDFELSFGKIRIRRGGSSGGHNGLGSIIESIGDDFWRIRVGIGNEQLALQSTETFVLSGFNDEEKEQILHTIGQTADLISKAHDTDIEHVSHNFS